MGAEIRPVQDWADGDCSGSGSTDGSDPGSVEGSGAGACEGSGCASADGWLSCSDRRSRRILGEDRGGDHDEAGQQQCGLQQYDAAEEGSHAVRRLRHLDPP